MKLQPLSNHVLVLGENQDAEVTKSGILLADSADKKKQMKGTVVAVGPGKLSETGSRLEMSVAVGAHVLFKEPWSGDNKIEDDGKKFFLIEEEDILGIIG